MDAATRRKVAQLVAGIVVTDDDLDPTEEAFVDRMLARFEIDDEERGAIFPILDEDEAADSFREMAPEVQQEALSMLIEAAAADGKVVDEERVYLDAVAKVAGLSPDDLQTRLDAALAAAG